MEIKSVYIHIPFCRNICSYCDFCKMFYNEEFANRYLFSLENEINNNYKNEILDTIYIGGGTPSSLSINQLAKLFSIISVFKISNNYEFTFEINVEDINEELLVFLKNNNVNRISIGVQTINSKFLKLIERNYNKDIIYEKILLAKKYFDNINIDFMYGFENETLDDLVNDLDFFIKLNVPHISIYSLILEEHTKLYINNTKQLSDDKENEMYYYIINYLEKNNYIQYEISNFSKKGYNSKHNLTYWNNNMYYGFGLGASGYINNIRYTNTRSLNKYCNGITRLEEESITIVKNMEYEMILGLRKIEGVRIDYFKNKYNIDLLEYFNINDLIKKELLIIKDNRIFINKAYLFVSNSILVNFIKNG